MLVTLTCCERCYIAACMSWLQSFPEGGAQSVRDVTSNVSNLQTGVIAHSPT